MDEVRTSTFRVLQLARSVSICKDTLEKEIEARLSQYTAENCPPDWSPPDGYHFRSADPEITAQYVLVLDALNFCFWPLPQYEYAQLAGSLKAVILNDEKAFSAQSLSGLTEEDVCRWLQPPTTFPIAGIKKEDVLAIPLCGARTRLLNEIGRGLLESFDARVGRASALIKAAGRSASKLVPLLTPVWNHSQDHIIQVTLVTRHFPGFRDHAIYQGEQVFFYKRAQIFVADVFLCFGGKGLGEFTDIASLTCFADYRLPQLLNHLGILRYSSALQAEVDRRGTILAGSPEELEIRAATVQCVELMKAQGCVFVTHGVLLRLSVDCPQQSTLQIESLSGRPILSLQLDNILWERGESQQPNLPPHHRTITIYY